jgi:hypothetical protein
LGTGVEGYRASNNLKKNKLPPVCEQLNQESGSIRFEWNSAKARKDIPSRSEVKEEKRREDNRLLFLYAATATATNHVTITIIGAIPFLSSTFLDF